MPETSISVFISYSRTDAAFVDHLEADLQARKFRIWVDRRKLEGGQEWLDEIEKAIDRCQVLLVVLSSSSVVSKYVKMEYRYAWEEHKQVVPLLYQSNAKVPIDLRPFQRINFENSYEQGFKDLLATLSRIEANLSVQQPPPTQEPQKFEETFNPKGLSASQQQSGLDVPGSVQEAPLPSWLTALQQQSSLETSSSTTPSPKEEKKSAPQQSTGYGSDHGPQVFAEPFFNRLGILHIEEGKEPGRVYEIRKESLNIGRSHESDIFLEDLAVSRLHASIINLGNGNYALKDEGSANGSKINGQLVNKYQSHPLQEGDKIQIGQTVLLFTKRDNSNPQQAIGGGETPVSGGWGAPAPALKPEATAWDTQIAAPKPETSGWGTAKYVAGVWGAQPPEQKPEVSAWETQTAAPKLDAIPWGTQTPLIDMNALPAWLQSNSASQQPTDYASQSLPQSSFNNFANDQGNPGIVRIEEGKEPGRVYEIRKESLNIGRSHESDIFLEDLAVSRLHASIINLGNGNYALKDEGSANGSKINGQLVNKYQSHPLQEGDKIQIGQTVLLFTKRDNSNPQQAIGGGETPVSGGWGAPAPALKPEATAWGTAKQIVGNWGAQPSELKPEATAWETQTAAPKPDAIPWGTQTAAPKPEESVCRTAKQEAGGWGAQPSEQKTGSECLGDSDSGNYSSS